MAFSQLSPMIQNQIRQNPTNLARTVRMPVKTRAKTLADKRSIPVLPVGSAASPAVRWPVTPPARKTATPVFSVRPAARTTARTAATAPQAMVSNANKDGTGYGSLSSGTYVPFGDPAPTKIKTGENMPSREPVGPPKYDWLKPYETYTGFGQWWNNNHAKYDASGSQLALMIKDFQDDAWRAKTTDFTTWLNSQPSLGLLGQNFDAQKAAYIAAHGGQAGQVLGSGYANLYDPKYMQSISEILLKGGNENTAPMGELAGLMTQNATGISPYAAAMLQNLRDHSKAVGGNAASLARRGLYGGGGVQDYAQATAGAALQNSNQEASKTWGPDRIAALGQQIIQNLQSLNTDQYAALTDALSRGLAGVPNPQVTGGVPSWNTLLGQWGSV